MSILNSGIDANFNNEDNNKFRIFLRFINTLAKTKFQIVLATSIKS